MEFRIIAADKNPVVAIEENGIFVASSQDKLDNIATANYQHNCSRLIVKKENIAETFFDLKTGLAGDVLQKVVNYHAALAIVGDFSGYTSKALKDFIYESNKGTRVFFAPDEAAAIQKLQTSVL